MPRFKPVRESAGADCLAGMLAANPLVYHYLANCMCLGCRFVRKRLHAPDKIALPEIVILIPVEVL